MTFKIFNHYKIINGVTDSSLGAVNPFTNFDSEKRIVRFLKNLGFRGVSRKDLIFADQIHGSSVHLCQKGDSGVIQLGVDALISNHKGQILVIKTADCVPILIYDPIKKVVAAIHTGRKSLTAGIIKKTILKMEKNYGTKPELLLVAIGPHIRICHYWLKPKSLENLQDTKWSKYFISSKARKKIPERRRGVLIKKEKIYFDMTKAAIDELKIAGVLGKNIEDCGVCTYCQYQKYYSARKKEENPKIYSEKLPCFASIIGMPRKNPP